MKISTFLVLILIIVQLSVKGQNTTGYIIKIEDSQIYLDLNKESIRVGQNVGVMLPGEIIIHPVTKDTILTEGKNIAVLEIIDIFDNYSISKLTSGNLNEIKIGMKINIIDSYTPKSNPLIDSHITVNESENVQQNVGQNVSVTNIFFKKRRDKDKREKSKKYLQYKVVEVIPTNSDVKAIVNRFPGKKIKPNAEYIVNIPYSKEYEKYYPYGIIENTDISNKEVLFNLISDKNELNNVVNNNYISKKKSFYISPEIFIAIPKIGLRYYFSDKTKLNSTVFIHGDLFLLPVGDGFHDISFGVGKAFKANEIRGFGIGPVFKLHYANHFNYLNISQLVPEFSLEFKLNQFYLDAGIAVVPAFKDDYGETKDSKIFPALTLGVLL